jgi:acetyl esterase/lipase
MIARREAFIALAATLTATVSLAGCSAAEVINTTTPSLGVKTKLGLPYGANPRQQVDMYWPDKVPANPRAVVFFYGGSWNSGSRSDYAFVGKALANRGITTVVADYRLNPEVQYPEFLKDCAAAVAWSFLNLDEIAGRKHQAVYVMGHSAGAYNAAMIALDPRWLATYGLRPQQLAGWIGLSGPYDFLPIGVPEVQKAFNHPNVPVSSQPINYAGQPAIRSFIATGANDTLVDPKRNSEALASRLRAANNEVSFRRYENVSHMTIIGALSLTLRLLDPVLEDIVMFIR